MGSPLGLGRYGSSVVDHDFASLVQSHLAARARDKNVIFTKLFAPAGEQGFAPWEKFQVRARALQGTRLKTSCILPQTFESTLR